MKPVGGLSMLLAGVGAALCLVVTDAHAGKVYIWTDAAGVRHITDTPPPETIPNVRALQATPAPQQAQQPSLPSGGTGDGALQGSGAQGEPGGAPEGASGLISDPEQIMDRARTLLPAAQEGGDATGTAPSAAGQSPENAAALEELKGYLQKLQQEKEAQELAARKARAQDDYYGKKRARNNLQEIDGRIQEAQDQLRKVSPKDGSQ